jgi:hypothetical protein
MQAYIQVGDLPQAEGLLRRTTALITKARTSGIPGMRLRHQYSIKGRIFESFFDNARAIVLEARGQYREAEDAYKRAADYRRGAIVRGGGTNPTGNALPKLTGSFLVSLSSIETAMLARSFALFRAEIAQSRTVEYTLARQPCSRRRAYRTERRRRRDAGSHALPTVRTH